MLDAFVQFLVVSFEAAFDQGFGFFVVVGGGDLVEKGEVGGVEVELGEDRVQGSL